MPPLTTTLGLNITPYISAMNTVRDVSSKAGTVTQASLRGAAREIEAAMVMAQGAGERTTFYAASLKAVNEQLAILSVNEARATAASEALALSQAKVAAGFGAQRDITAVNAALTAGNIARLQGPASAQKTDELNKLFNIAAAGGVGASLGTGVGFGHGGGHGGGISGILRETLVIIREIMRHNFSRVPGSIALLAKNLGLLGIVVKSSAKDSLLAAAAEDKLAASMARTALVAEAKAATAAQDIVSEGADAEATLENALANEQLAITSRQAALAQAEKAAAARASAEVQLAGATTTIAAGGYIVLALIAAGAAAYFLYRHFHNLSGETKKLADLMNPFRKQYTEEAEAVKNDSKAHQEFTDWLKRELQTRQSISEVLEHQIRLMNDEYEAQRRLAELRGASAIQLEQMDEAELKRKHEATAAALAEAEAERSAAVDAAKKASADYTSNPTDERGVDLLGAQRVAKNAGTVMDTVQDLLEKTNINFLGQTVGQGVFYKKAQDDVKEHGADTPLPPQYMANMQSAMGLKGDEKTYGEALSGMRVSPPGLPPMTLGEAKGNYNTAMAELTALENTAQALKDAETNTKKTVEERQSDVTKLQAQFDQEAAVLGIKSKYGPQEAALGRGGSVGDKVTERERVGVGSPQIALLSVAFRQLQATQETNKILMGIKALPLGQTSAAIARSVVSDHGDVMY